MNNAIPQALPGFDGCEVDAPKKLELPPFKYLEIEVTRTQSNIVYLKVPRDYDMNKIKRIDGKNSIIPKACEETTDDSDWDSWGWEDTVEWESVKEV